MSVANSRRAVPKVEPTITLSKCKKNANPEAGYAHVQHDQLRNRDPQVHSRNPKGKRCIRSKNRSAPQPCYTQNNQPHLTNSKINSVISVISASSVIQKESFVTFVVFDPSCPKENFVRSLGSLCLCGEKP